MGSVVNNCCGESSITSKQGKKISNSQHDNKIKKVSKSLNAADQITTFTEQDLFKLLGKIIKLEPKIQIQDFQILGILGQGAFGIVYLGQLKNYNKQEKQEKYAIKRVPKQLLADKNLINSALDQRDILAMCNRFLVSLIMAFQDSWFLYLVMDYAAGGDTYSLIKNGSFKFNSFKETGENGIRFIVACVILALQFLHSNNYMYRDLKPENVLLFANGYVKLTDFGLVKKQLQGKKSQTISGTQLYYAPQMVLNKGYGKQIDFWTLGIYIYQLSNYEPPFHEQQITKKKFETACLEASKNRKWLNPDLSIQIKDLINALLVFNVNQRIGVKNGWKQVKDHAFFKDFQWQKLSLGLIQSPLQKIVNMFPSSIKPFRPEPKRQQVGQKKIEGWSLVKKNTQ